MPRSAPHPTSGLQRIRSVAAALLLWPARVAAARAVLGQMAGMSECELRDVGLSRQDVRDAAALPMSADPGRLFRDRARERGEARQASLPFCGAPPTVPDLPNGETWPKRSRRTERGPAPLSLR